MILRSVFNVDHIDGEKCLVHVLKIEGDMGLVRSPVTPLFSSNFETNENVEVLPPRDEYQQRVWRQIVPARRPLEKHEAYLEDAPFRVLHYHLLYDIVSTTIRDGWSMGPPVLLIGPARTFYFILFLLYG
jgi:hypothetical protein